MDYSLRSITSYIKGNWKHLLAGAVSYYIVARTGGASKGLSSVMGWAKMFGL